MTRLPAYLAMASISYHPCKTADNPAANCSTEEGMNSEKELKLVRIFYVGPRAMGSLPLPYAIASPVTRKVPLFHHSTCATH